MKRTGIYVIMLLGLLVAGCRDIDPVEPLAAPMLVSTDPADGSTELDAKPLTVTLTFNQSVKCLTSDHSKVSLDGGAVIDKIYFDQKDLMTDISGLEKGKTYILTFPKGTIQGLGQNQSPVDEIRLSFSTKYTDESSYVLEPEVVLVNPKASKEARNVYNFLLKQSGKKTLSGVQSSHSHKNDFIDAVYNHTGKHPALAGYDFLFLQFSPTPEGWSWIQNYNDISAPKEQWAANGLVNYMWHWNVPNSKADWDNGVNNYNFDGYAFYSDQTSFDIREALKPGTWQNDFIMKDIEEVAGYLQLLENENIPVIWRPLHEAAGNYGLYEGGGSGAWFWWGRYGAEPCKQLWRLLYDQLVNVHGLDNLIWVWTVDVVPTIPYAQERNLDWYPGDEYVDILGVDIYETNTDAKTRQYQALVDLTKGKKLVTVSECGNIPDPSKCMDAGNRWSWFMVWPTADDNGSVLLNSPDQNFKLNTLDYWKKVMGNQYVITREAMPSLK